MPNRETSETTHAFLKNSKNCLCLFKARLILSLPMPTPSSMSTKIIRLESKLRKATVWGSSADEPIRGFVFSALASEKQEWQPAVDDASKSFVPNAIHSHTRTRFQWNLQFRHDFIGRCQGRAILSLYPPVAPPIPRSTLHGPAFDQRISGANCFRPVITSWYQCDPLSIPIIAPGWFLIARVNNNLSANLPCFFPLSFSQIGHHWLCTNVLDVCDEIVNRKALRLDDVTDLENRNQLISCPFHSCVHNFFEFSCLSAMFLCWHNHLFRSFFTFSCEGHVVF